MATLGMRIRLARVEQYMSQDELAEKSGISRTAMGNIERGKSRPKKETLERIAQVLGKTANELKGVK